MTIIDGLDQRTREVLLTALHAEFPAGTHVVEDLGSVYPTDADWHGFVLDVPIDGYLQRSGVRLEETGTQSGYGEIQLAVNPRTYGYEW